jgi:hypothetical protein
MPTVTQLNGNVHEVDQKFIEAITRRLHLHLLKIRSNRLDIDSTMIGSELQRLYTDAIARKPWYNDFIAHFCKQRGIR